MASSTQAIPRARANVERKIAASLEDGRLNNNNTNLSKGKRNVRASSSSSNKLKLYYKYCFGILASLYIFFHYILSDQLQFETVKIILLMCGGIETSFKSQHGQDRFAFKTFFPDNAVEYFVSYYDYYQPEAYLPSSDTYIEKDLSINDEIEKLRLSTTTSLLSG